MADDPPPPPYLAPILQQLEMNRQFMAGVIAQLPNPNAPVTLQEFVRLNPSTFRNSANPMDADDWLRDIASQMESAAVALASYVTYATYHLRGPAAQWWESHRSTLPSETVTTWQEFQLAFRAWHIARAAQLLFPGFLPRREVEEGISEALLIYTTYYYTLLHQLMLHCYYNHAIINCWLFSSNAARCAERC